MAIADDSAPPGALVADHPFDRLIRALKAHGCRVQQLKEDTARLTCPTHPDRYASLGVTRRPETVLVHCFAGCKTSDVMGSVGLRMADLFVKGSVRPEPSRIVATYDYYDINGELLAQKVRLHPKHFFWRRPDPSRASKWLARLDGAKPGLYRLPDLVDVTQVFCLEGEKAVDLFWTLGLPACCPPSGASSWKSEWSADLQRAGCVELVVLPDADRPGVTHAERIAAASWELPAPLPVKVIALPGLPAGADAFDWIRDGHSTADLLRIVSSASYWEPGALERARADRKRALTNERVKRWRQREKE